MQADPPSSPQDLVAGYLRLVRQKIAAPDNPPSVTPGDPTRPTALILSPHPDDECLTGALPLRLRREQNWRVVNLAVTLGSDVNRRAPRRGELIKACATLGFECQSFAAGENAPVTAAARAENSDRWREMALALASVIAVFKPQAIFLPHAADAHPAHAGAHWLGMDALASLPAGFSCAVLETEYWQPNAEPNLMIGIGENDAAALLAALACHAGENARNPFDARFPAFLIDNVRRGSERVAGAGAASAQIDFAMLYRYGLWKNGKFMPSALARIRGAEAALADLFS